MQTSNIKNILIIFFACYLSASCSEQKAKFQKISMCGIRFDLSSMYLVRTMRIDGDMTCRIDFKKKSREPLECKLEGEGGEAPYEVCDWSIGHSVPEPYLVGKHGTLQKDVVNLGDFSYAEGNWTMSNAQSSPEPATEAFVFGVPGFEGKGVSRGYWVRSRVKEFPAIYAGSYEHNGVIVQLSPKIAVAVMAPEEIDIKAITTPFRY